MAQSILKEILGLSNTEIQTYFTLLNLGPQPASVIAGKVGCPRSSMYPILERLIKKGIVATFIRRQIKYFSAIPLKKLEEKLQEVENTYAAKMNLIKENRAKIRDYFESFKSQDENRFLDVNKVQTYAGIEGVKNMWKMICSGQESLYCLSWNSELKCEPESINLWKEFIQEYPEFNTRAKSIFLDENMNFKRDDNNKYAANNCHVLVSDSFFGYFGVNNNTQYGIMINDREMVRAKRRVLSAIWDKYKED